MVILKMTYSLSRYLCSFSSGFRKILSQKNSFHLFMRKHPSRNTSSTFPSCSFEEKYGKLRNRIALVPCLDLLKNEADRIQHDVCFENNERSEDLQKWCLKVFDYNVRNSRFYLSKILLKSYCAFGFSMDDATWNQCDSEGWKSAVILAWCTELNLSYCLMIDDIMDQSNFRREKICWHKKPGIGLSAVYDSRLLQWSIFKLLQKYFSDAKFYINVLQEFFEKNLEIAYGECMDTMISANEKSRYEEFTFEKFKILAEYKCESFFRLPVHLAMHLAGNCSAEDFDFVEKFSLKIGLYFQSQDDGYDFALPVVQSGLVGNDIRKGNLTWFSARFFEEASVSMKTQFMENYGIDDEDAVKNILELYEKANLFDKFQEFEEKISAEISNILETTNDVKAALFYDIFHELKHRKKISLIQLKNKISLNKI